MPIAAPAVTARNPAVAARRSERICPLRTGGRTGRRSAPTPTRDRGAGARLKIVPAGDPPARRPDPPAP
ncbi:MAG: hypothetical protein ABIX46_00155, partial [Burkholderiaceae bacterium]